MAIGLQPSVFISSTCYDLAQVRHDLRKFISSLGINPILSEFSSFPVNPDLDAVGNCLANVKEKADLFVLVVGGRYGSEAESGKSVTNLEYLEAKARGIPRYVFVQKGILNALPIWQKNPTADFTGIVDSPKLFEFVESLRDPKENWIFAFESAQDIESTLLQQLAYLFKDALDIRAKVRGAGIPASLNNLSGTSLALAVQKPFAWEHRLFSQVFADEILQGATARRDLEYGIVLGKGIRLDDIHTFIDWIQTKMGEIQGFAESASKIFNIALPKAVGAPGEPGAVDEIVYVGQRLGQVYRRLVEWSLDFAQAQVNEEFTDVLNIISRAARNAIIELEDFSCSLQGQISDAVARYEETKEPQSLEINLIITSPNMDDLGVELRKLSARLGIPYSD